MLLLALSSVGIRSKRMSSSRPRYFWPRTQNAQRAALSPKEIYGRFVRSSMAGPGRGEKTVRTSSLTSAFNDCSGEIDCNAAMSVLHRREDAAPANTRKCNGGSVPPYRHPLALRLRPGVSPHREFEFLAACACGAEFFCIGIISRAALWR